MVPKQPLLGRGQAPRFEAVRCFSHQASEAAWDPGNPFSGRDRSARAWLAWKDARVEDVVRHATAAMQGGPKRRWLSITTRAFAFGR